MGGTKDAMSPQTSPHKVTKKFGVRRVNGRPMYIICAVVVSFVLVMMLVAADRAAQQNAVKEKPQEKAGNTSMFAHEIVGTETDGFIAAEEISTETFIKESSVLKQDEELLQQMHNPLLDTNNEHNPLNQDLNSLSSQNKALQPESNDDAQRIRTAKMHMLEAAIKAKTGVQTLAASSSNNASQSMVNHPQSRQDMINEIARIRQQNSHHSSNDPTTAYQQRIAQIQDMQTHGGLGASVSNSNNTPLLVQTSANSDNEYSQFDGKESDRWSLNAHVQMPKSPYELRAGFVIPATLVSGINSNLPGQIIAQVSQDVSDTATGNYILIPQGARLVGTYSNDVSFGQERILIAWQRIIFPDGKALDIGSMPGADAAGYSGFQDQMNNHYMRIFGSAFLMSGVTAGVTLSQNDDNGNANNSQRASDALSEALGQQFGQVIVEMIRKNMNVAPTLEIRPGYRFNVIVTKDMTFPKPYSSFDY